MPLQVLASPKTLPASLIRAAKTLVVVPLMLAIRMSVGVRAKDWGTALSALGVATDLSFKRLGKRFLHPEKLQTKISERGPCCGTPGGLWSTELEVRLDVPSDVMVRAGP